MTPYDAARMFVDDIDDTAETVEVARRRDAVARKIAAALERNLAGSKIGRRLGNGTFGTAFEYGDQGQYVFKLTTDPQEAQASGNLLDATLPNVARIFAVYRLKGIMALNMWVDRRMRVYVVVLERVQAALFGAASIQVLQGVVKDAKDKFGVWPNDLLEAEDTDAKTRLQEAAAWLVEQLEASKWSRLHEVAAGIRQLATRDIYGVDFHYGNVGLDPRTNTAKIFDLGVSVSPQTEIAAKNPRPGRPDQWGRGGPSWYTQTTVPTLGERTQGWPDVPLSAALVEIPELD